MACKADGFNSDVGVLKSCGSHEKHAVACCCVARAAATQRSQSGAKIDSKQDVFSCSTVLRSSRFQYKLNQEGESENKRNDEKWVQNER
jgi:hypothetical protein